MAALVGTGTSPVASWHPERSRSSDYSYEQCIHILFLFIIPVPTYMYNTAELQPSLYFFLENDQLDPNARLPTRVLRLAAYFSGLT